MLDLRAFGRVVRSYQRASLGTRAFVVARFVVAPTGRLADEFRGLDGSVLSLASGLSMLERYLAEIGPDLTFEGIDLDPAKVALIAATQDRSPRVTLTLGDATALDRPARYDVVLVCDALHHFPSDRHAEVARAIAAALRPGGIVLVKDLDAGPAWKYRWNRLHDRIVAGPEPICCRTPTDMATLFTAAGLEVEQARRIDHRFTPYAHYLLRARKPA